MGGAEAGEFRGVLVAEPFDRWGRLGAAAGGRYPSAATRDGRLRPQAIGAIIAAACAAAGLGAEDPADSRGAGRAAAGRRHTGHSLRRGGATSMLKAGASPLTVSRHGRWTDGSRSFAGYVEEATGFGDDNPTKGLL